MGLPAGGRSLTVPKTLVCAAERGINTFSVCAAPAPLGASGFGPNPVARAPHHHITTTLHHRRASPPSPPSTSPPPRALPPLSFLLHSPPHGSTSPEGPWSAACKSPRQTGQPDARTREPYRGRVSGSRAPQWPRVGLGSPLRKIAGRALALAPVAGGVPNTPYPYCVHVCPSVSVCVWCRATCGGQKSTCSACVPAVGVCVSRGAMLPVRAAGDRRWPPVFRPSLTCRLAGCSRRLCCLSACVRAMSCLCLLCRSSLDERLYRDMCVELCVR